MNRLPHQLAAQIDIHADADLINVYDVDQFGHGRELSRYPAIGTIPTREMAISMTRQVIEIHASSAIRRDFRILIMNYDEDECSRYVIGQLLYAPQNRGYTAESVNHIVRRAIPHHLMRETIMIVGLRFENEAEIIAQTYDGPGAVMSQTISVWSNRIEPGTLYSRAHIQGRQIVREVHNVMRSAEWHRRRELPEEPLVQFTRRPFDPSPSSTRHLVPTSPPSVGSLSLEPIPSTSTAGRPTPSGSLLRPMELSSSSSETEGVAPNASECDFDAETVIFDIAPVPILVPGRSGVNAPTVMSIETIIISSDESLTDVKVEPEESRNVNFQVEPEVHTVSDEENTERSIVIQRPLNPRRLETSVRTPRNERRRNLNDIRQRRLSGYNSDYEPEAIGDEVPAYADNELGNITDDEHGWCHICAMRLVDFQWQCGHLTCTACVRRLHHETGFVSIRCPWQCGIQIMSRRDHPMDGNFHRYREVSHFTGEYRNT